MRRDDLALIALGAATAVASLALALAPAAADPAPGGEAPLALVAQQSGAVQRRPAATLGWRRLARGMGLADGDAVFVPPGGETVLRFEDGTELALDERSLVVVERPRGASRTLQLRQGSLQGRVGTVALRLETPQGAARLEASAEARVEVGQAAVEVAVKKGGATVAAPDGAPRAVAAGERVQAAGAAVTALPAWPVTLLGPDPTGHLRFTGRPGPLELSWTGAVPRGARLQLARDRLFAFVDADRPVSGDRLELDRPTPGVTWWRLVDERGVPLSEARRFVLVEDLAPVAVVPRPGEVVMAPPGTAVPFAWTALAGVGRYRLEVASSDRFERLAFSLEVGAPEARAVPQLAEGTWYWRARASDGPVPGLPSEPSRFRVIHRGIPDAPELYAPEIEVQH